MSERDIFIAALQKDDPAERRAYLDAACAARPELRRQVEQLLRLAEDAGSFLEKPAAASAATGAFPAGADAAALSETPGTTLGRYKLVEPVGEGGMGEVWLAQQQEPVKRLVALKVIKAGMDTRQVLARFEAERQALALMDHPNIAKVLDGGATPTGRPFFVMELVKGVPITRYCDEHRLTPRQRLELFVQVCQAVQHAHTKGIIHRDIKPSNVLVAPYDGQPVVKMIDFGVAKAAGQPLTDKTLVTGLGAVVGTPEYMSPEQAELNNQDVDTRSDVYSLGVLLYELLTGTTPLTHKRLRNVALLEVLRAIREEEPPRPSTRLSTADGLPSIAASRGLEPKKLSGLVRGELDWIAMKALEKDRGRRYETANGFAMDVQRYLANEAVLACPPSAGYRFRKFARRNRLRLVVGGGAGLALVVAASGVAVAVGWAVRDREAVAQQAAFDAATRRAKLEGKVTEYLEEVRARYEGDDLPGALAAVGRAEERMAGGTEAGDELRQRVAEWRAELQVIEHLDEVYNGAMYARPSQADATYAQVFRGLGIDVDELSVEEAGNRVRSRLTRKRLAESLDQWADLLLDVAVEKNRGPMRSRPRLVEIARAADPDPLRTRVRLVSEKWDGEAAKRLAGSAETDRLSFQGLRQLTTVIYWTGGEAGRQTVLRLLKDALARRPGDFRLARSLAGRYARWDPPRWGEAAHYWSVALAIRPENPYVQGSLADALLQLGDLDAAVAGYRRVIRLKPAYARGHTLLGNVLSRKGQFAEAGAEFREAIRLDSDDVAAHNLLGAVLSHQGQQDEAIGEFREAIRLDNTFALAHSNLGLVLRAQGRDDEAIAALREAIRLNRDCAPAHDGLAAALRATGRMDEAVAEYREVIRLAPNDAQTHIRLGDTLDAQGRRAEAQAAYREGKRLIAATAQADAQGHLNTALKLQGAGFPVEAMAECRTALDLKPDFAQAHWHLGTLLHAKGQAAEATAEWDKALAGFREAIRLKPDDAHAHNNLAWLLATCPDPKFRDPPAAVAAAGTAVKLTPAEGIFWNSLGVAHYRAGDWKAALDTLSKSTGLRAGGDANDWFFLAMALWQQGDGTVAREWYDRAMAWTEKNNPKGEELGRFRAEATEHLLKALGVPEGDVRGRIERGNALRDAGDLFAAVALLSAVITRDPTQVDALVGRGKCYLRKNEFARAADDFSAAIALRANCVDAWDGRAFAFFGLQQWEKSVADFSEAIKLNPRVHSFWHHRGHAHLNLKQWDKAAADFTKVVEGWPDGWEGWYLRAGAYAQANRPDKALADLRQAFAKGFKDVQLLKNESRFDPLRSNADFQKLTAGPEKK